MALKERRNTIKWKYCDIGEYIHFFLLNWVWIWTTSCLSFSIREKPGPSSRSITTSTWWRQPSRRLLHRTWPSIWLLWVLPLDLLATLPGPPAHTRLQCPPGPRQVAGPCPQASAIMNTTPVHSIQPVLPLQITLGTTQALKAKMWRLSTAATL